MPITSNDIRALQFVEMAAKTIEAGALTKRQALSALRNNPTVSAFVERAREARRRAESELEYLTREFNLAA